nr:unnamed protein product [Callosobruchus chinensis]
MVPLKVHSLTDAEFLLLEKSRSVSKWICSNYCKAKIVSSSEDSDSSINSALPARPPSKQKSLQKSGLLDDLQTSISSLMKQNAIIVGLSESEIKQNVKKVFNKLEFQANEDEYRIQVLNSKANKKPVSVKFRNEEAKKRLIEARRRIRRLNSQECGIPGVTSDIYINEDLSKDVRFLFSEARSLKNHQFKYVWCRNSKVFARKDDGRMSWPIDRGDGRRGGGVGIFVHSDLSVDLVEDCSDVSNFIEQIWITIRISNIEYVCGIVYRPPGHLANDSLECLERSLICMLSRSKEIVLMGDLNVDLMTHNSKSQQLEDMFHSFNLSQLVTKPTRVTPQTTTSLLDIICVTNVDLSVGGVTHIDMHEATDHQLVCVELETTVPKASVRHKTFSD